MSETVKACKKLNKTALIIACIHFFVSFFTDRLIFRYFWFDFSNRLNILKSIETIGVKLLFFALVLMLWQGIFYFAKKASKDFEKIALFYFAFMMIMLLLTYPGIWRMDEFGILSSATFLYPNFWQNYMTSVFYIFALMLVPFPAGVLVVMNLVISLCVARMITLIWEKTGMSGIESDLQNTSKNARNFAKWVLLLPFILPPVVDSNLYPMRMSLYGFLELLLLIELWSLWEKLSRKDELEVTSVSYIYEFYIAILAALVTMWRAEAIYYVIMIVVIYILMGWRKPVWTLQCKRIALYLMCFVILFVPQKLGEKISSGDQYELTATLLPLVPLVEEANQNGDTDILEKIDKVVNVELILQGAKEGKTGINLFWSEPDFQRDYSTEDFASFRSEYQKMILKYPIVFLAERWKTFLDSSDLLENTTEIFVKENVPNYENFQTYFLNKPISNNLRTSVVKILEFRSANDYLQKVPGADFVYSAIPGILIMMVACVILLIKRKWLQLLLLITPLVKVPLIFLTAPSRLFMYYYSLYLIGGFLLAYGIYCWCLKPGKGDA